MGLMGIGQLVNMVTGLMAWYAYDLAYDVTIDDSATSANILLAEAVMSAIKEETVWSTLDGLTTELGMASVAEEWYMWNMWKSGAEMEREEMDGDRPPREDGQGPPPQRELMAQIINYVNF